jgi:hypothetical protein
LNIEVSLSVQRIQVQNVQTSTPDGMERRGRRSKRRRRKRRSVPVSRSHDLKGL